MNTPQQINEIKLNNVLNSQNTQNKSVQKYVLKLQNNENGNLLTVHHTIEEKNDGTDGAGGDAASAIRLIRVRLAASCFNSYGQYVVVDKRGNIFVFDFAVKRFWKFPEAVSKVCLIKASTWQHNHYFLGTKHGKLIEIDTEQCRVLRVANVCQQSIHDISFAAKCDKDSNIALLLAGREAIIFDLIKFAATYRLDFEAVRIQLKFASFIPHSDEIFTCFTNDGVHVWSTQTLASLRFTNVTKARDRKLRLMQQSEVPEFKFPNNASIIDHPVLPDFTEGLIMCYCYSANGKLLCCATADYYLLLLGNDSLEQQQIFRLNNFLLKQCILMPNIKDTVVLGLTCRGKVVLLDCSKADLKLLLEFEAAEVDSLTLSPDGKLLGITLDNDEAQVWSIAYMYSKLKAQQRSMAVLKEAFKEPISNRGHVFTMENPPIDSNLRALLTPARISELLQEYHCFPGKFRALIWCTLLQLPGNKREFQQLLKLGTPSSVRLAASRIPFKNETIKRAVLKVWSCLAHWCKVFGYSDIIPQLIFPFVKLLPKNSFVVFEILVTLLLNHFNLWFEFHPLEPANYLAMIENILKFSDLKLWEFYEQFDVKPKDYAWSLLANAFAEVLDDEQWLMLWDNVIGRPTDTLIYVVVAYNMLQREVITRLPDRSTIQYYFREQNPIDLQLLLSKAEYLRKRCPAHLRPQRYIKTLEPIPANVYPKFLNYPREQLVEQEVKLAEIKLEHKTIDARIRQLELEELRMQEQLQEGLKKEESAKRMKELERAYKETIRREEARIATQRKLLLLYQKEVRQRKSELVSTLEASEQRRKQLLMSSDMEMLRKDIESERLRNDTALQLAEDQLRNTAFELQVGKQFAANSEEPKLSHKYRDDLERLYDERSALSRDLFEIQSGPVFNGAAGDSLDTGDCNLDNILDEFNAIYKEFKELKD